MIDINIVKKHAMIELAKRDFFYYCNIIAPDFYKKDRDFLVELCNDMQSFYESEDEILIINLPPRHGKSRTAGLFVEWVLGKDDTKKIMTGSYNETLSTVFSKNVRNSIQQQKVDENIIVYSDIFENRKVKKGDASMNLWSLESGYNNYLATSPSGTATGFGCNLMLIDDLIKNAEEAFNENTLEKHWSWFTNTMLSRLEEGGKIIIIMTRWATNDLAGKAIKHFQEEGKKIKVIIKKALQGNGKMLCDSILSLSSYKSKIRAMGEEIATANYQQTPIDVKGRLYQYFMTYDEAPKYFTSIISYCDTADEGKDYLCNIIAGIYNKQAYVLDVYYTKDGMEVTERETAKRLYNFGVNIAHVESNAGGRSFARNVQKELLTTFKSNYTTIKWFHQSKNKIARILSNSTWVMNNIFFPANWKDRFPQYYSDMIKYQKEGKNKNDDAPDATTGIAEKIDRATPKPIVANI